VSAKKKKRKTGYRTPPPRPSAVEERDAAPRSGGLLRNVFSAPPVPANMSPLPLYRESFSRGFVAVGSSPFLLLVPMVLVLGLWFGLLAGGYVGTPAQPLVNAFAIPPLSVTSDAFAVFTVFGQRAGLYLILPVLIVRAIVTGVLAAAIVDRLETGRVGAIALLRGLRAFPIVLGMLIVGFIGAIAGQFAGAFLGPGIGLLVSGVALPAFLVFALGFVPFVAVTESRSLGDAFRRAYGVARSPGGRHFMLSALYLLALNVVPLVIPIGSQPITAAPTLGQWVGILVLTVFHMGFLAAFGYRYLMGAPVVPEVVPRTRAGR